MVKKVVICLIILMVTSSLFSEVDLDASLSGMLTLANNEEGDFTSTGLAKGDLTVKSKGNKYVKSQLTLDFVSVRNVATVTIAKAWVKFRYPKVRGTVGKNRITWGEGTAFNAGDVIFDDYIAPSESEAETLDLTADELKSINRTMALLAFPLGKFTIAEVIYLPYDFLTNAELTTAATTNTPPEDKEVYEHSYGGRLLTKAKGIKIESGYIYNGIISTHKPYVSFNGTLLLDYHLSSSINVKHGESDFDFWKESVKVSGGLFYLFELENDKTLTLRLETMLKPYGTWEHSENESEQKEYGVLLYPEVAFVPGNDLSLFFRSIVSPIDVSCKNTFGVNWKTYQGFTIGSFISINLGERGDIYSIKDNNSIMYTMLFTHKF